MPGETILIIDDNPMNLKLERVVLEVENYKVKTAKSAEEAMTVLETFSPQLILMDVQLPEMDGIDLTRRLKADARYKHIHILIVTSNSQKGDEQRAWDAGCDGYIHKPIDTQALPVIVGSYFI